MDERTTEDLRETKPGRQRPVQAPVSRRRRWPAFVGLLAVAVAALAWWLLERPAPQTTPAGRGNTATATPVVTDTAQKADIDITLDALGTVTSLATVTIKSQISGHLTHIAFEEGQMVKQGDPLAEIDARPYELTLAQAQGQLLRDQALLDDAQLDLARYQKLAVTNAIPKQQLDTQASLVKQDQGVVAGDQAQIDTAKLNIAYCHIVAPVSGRVGLRQVDLGNYVTPGDATGIVVITQLQPIAVIFTLPEDDLPPILKRLHDNAKLSVTAFDRSGATQLATGSLSTLDNQIDTTTGTLKLKAQFANTDESLFPNQFVNIRLLVDVLRDTTVVPSGAIQRGAPGTFVYLVNADQTVAVRPVTLGPTSGDRVTVRTGLSTGDRIVVDGADRLRDGAKVSVPNANGGSATPGGPATAQPGGRRGSRNGP
jgi:multidrug efflux system membrane fusion protein